MGSTSNLNHPISNIRLIEFEKRIAEERARLLSHPIYQTLTGIESVRTFMKYHVFAVWDFMSLLKSLQIRLTTVTVPWVPPASPRLSRLINEIVLAEECDEVGADEFLSHFELYLLAMKEAGADSNPILEFISKVKTSGALSEAFESLEPMDGVREFVTTTFQIVSGKTHEVASSFLFGREDVIPEMFQLLLSEKNLLNSDSFKRMKQYLERHIEVDGDHHGPLARRMLIELCGEDSIRWDEAEVAAVKSIQARSCLWDFLLSQMQTGSEKTTDSKSNHMHSSDSDHFAQ
jgi:pyrroloquinoline quinone (PQQ) biosynthesis protein C